VNRLSLLARIVERDALRYTPAGIPMQGLKLEHESTQIQAAGPRQVRLEMAALAAGAPALALRSAQVGDTLEASGFLAPRRQGTRTLVFHITELNRIESKD